MRLTNTERTTRRKAWGVTRVSTDRQAEQGDSLEAQRRSIELIAELEGFDLVAVYADAAVSGSVPLAQRPEGSRLLAAVEPGGVVIASRLDRVFRDATDATATLKWLRKRNVGLYLKDLGGDVTESNVSALVFGLLSNVAEFERSRIAERIADVKKSQRAQSRFLGGDVPLGFCVEIDPATAHLPNSKRIIVPNGEVQSLVRKLKQQGYSARLAAGQLTALGHRTTHKSVLKLWATLGLLTNRNS